MPAEAGGAWTPAAAIDAAELWVFWMWVIFFGSRAHQLRRVQTHPLRRSRTAHGLSLRALSTPPAPAGVTTVETTPVQEHAFWRRVYVVQWVFIGLGCAGVYVTSQFSPGSRTLLLPFLLQGVWLYSASAPDSVSLRVRWHSICSVFFISLWFVACELFRYAYGYEMSAGHWVSVALLGVICVLAGTVPGRPRSDVHGGRVVRIALAEDAHERTPSGDEEEPAPPPVMQLAPSEPMDNSMLGTLFFMHVMTLVRAVRRHGVLRSRDVPVLGRELHAETLGAQAERAWAQGDRGTRAKRKRVDGIEGEGDGGGGGDVDAGVEIVDDIEDGVIAGADLDAEDAPLLGHTQARDESAAAPAAPAPAPAPSAMRLLAALVRANALSFVFVCVLTLVSVVAYYAPAFFANRIFGVLEAPDAELRTPRETLRSAMPYVLGLFFTVVSSSTLQGALWSRLEGSLVVRLATQLSMLLFRKTLTREDAARVSADGQGSQQVLTLQLVDVERIVSMTFHLFAAITTPIELALGGYFAYRVLGVSALVGLATSIVLMPCVGVLSRALRASNGALMSARDKRTSLLSECFVGIRMIKAQAWEQVLDRHIADVRAEELRHQRRTFVCEALMATVLELNPLLVTFVSFLFYTEVLHHTLTPSAAFTALAVFTELRWAFLLLPRAVANFLQTLVSARRVAAYLGGADVLPSPDTALFVPPSECTLRLEHATFAWPSHGGASFKLSDIDVAFPPGTTLVCGRVGSGKSLVLHALLHEAHMLSGRVHCPRSPRTGVPYDAATSSDALAALNTPAWLRADLVAYAPQVPFLMHTTIRDNILFGLPLGDGQHYRATLDACGLQADLAAMEHGDLTQVGENGMELSGGQKARVALARAVYSRARIVLLDDVLSAVDAHTCKHIVDHLLCGPLLAGRTVVLVTHHVVQVARAVQQLVYIEDGRVAYVGDAHKFLASAQGRSAAAAAPAPAAAERAPPGVGSGAGDGTGASTGANTGAGSAGSSTGSGAAAAPAARTEHRETGGIAWGVWLAYVRASSGWTLCMLTMLLFALANLWELVTNLWVRDWSASRGREHTAAWWLERYAALLVVGVAFGVLRWVGIYTMSLRASRHMFSQMTWRTLRAPLRFFDTMTRGRLLNRFGQDMEVLDTKFATAMADVAIRVTQLLATTIALFMVGGIGFVLALLALMPVYAAIAHAYMMMARDLQRLRATSRSLVTASLAHAVHGVQVIRAFGAQEHFVCEMMGLLDNNNRFVWWAAQGGRWVSQMFNLVSSFLVLASCVLLLLQPHTHAASVDFSLTFLIDLNFVLLILMRMYTQLQVNAVAVERVFEFATSIEQEGAEVQHPRPPAAWPDAGHVRVQDLALRYAPDAPDTLRGVSFDVPPRTKLAIVGPTGSGKSSLLNALLRFVEPHAGSVHIDGWDTARVGLCDLRSRIYVVPQDPVILSGSLRAVLDPRAEFTDDALLDALRRVRLAAPEHTAFTHLDMPIAENGANLSQGERQLLCVARALLHKSRIVLFDEASSSVDHSTDSHLTQCIHDAFQDSTVLTIAHRLRTVIHYDRILYMHRGRVVETGSPAQLLANKASHFYKLCEQTGPDELAHLVKAAHACSA